MASQGPKDGELLPVPDPTLLTTSQITREIMLLKELIFTRLEAQDRSAKVFEEFVHKVPADIAKEIAHARDAFDERFKSVTLQFAERDRRFAQGDHDSKDAIHAAFNAAKDLGIEQKNAAALATQKSETASEKRMEQLSTLIQSNTKGLEDKIAAVRDLQASNARGLEATLSAVRDRLTLIEGKGFGVERTQDKQHASSGLIVAVFVAAVSFLALIVTLFTMATTTRLP